MPKLIRFENKNYASIAYDHDPTLLYIQQTQYHDVMMQAQQKLWYMHAPSFSLSYQLINNIIIAKHEI